MRTGVIIKLATGVATLAFTAGTANAQATAGSQTTETPTTDQADATNEASGYETQEIVVTASKRAQPLRNVPSAISVVNAETIETLGIEDFRDYASLVPGLSQRDFGAPGSGAIILRGLNTGPQQTTNTSAFYIDEAPFTASGFLSFAATLTPEPDLADVERIEILKGPQGTLYGANNLGGLIRIITQKPSSKDFFGSARAEIADVDGGGMGYSARGSLNIPLIRDKLAMRATAFYRKSPGYTDNVGTGTKNVNDGRYKGARLSLRATPTDNLTIDLSGLYQNIDSQGFAYQDNESDTLNPIYGKYKYSQFADLPSRIRYRLVNGVVDYDIGPGSVITSLSYARYKTQFSNDLTQIFGPLLGGLVPPDGGLPLFQSPKLKKFSAETRFVSDRLGPVEFVAGAFYTDEKASTGTDIPILDANGQPLAPPFGLLISNETQSRYKEIAGFGNVTFYITEQLDVTGGIRYAENDQRAIFPESISFFAPVPASAFKFDDSATTYLATLRWRPTNRISTFLRAASGYRPGGPQAQATLPPGAQEFIKSDSVWNYEAGVKAGFLNGRVNLNASVFHIDWNDIQLSSIFQGRAFAANGGQAKVDGFEIELQAAPTQQLNVSASLGHTNARLTQIDPEASLAIGAVKGDKLPLTPQWTAALTAEQAIPISSSLDGTVGATLRHQSRMHSSYPASANADIRIPAITTVDLRAGLEFERYRVQFRVENLFDKLGYSTVATNRAFPGQPVPTVASVIRPRTFVLSLSTDF